MRLLLLFAIFSFLILLNCCGLSRQQKNNIPERSKLVILCKTWGFLKYNHPNISTSSINWDSVLIANIDTVLSMGSYSSLKLFYNYFIPELNDSLCIIEKCDGDSILLDNVSTKWMHDTSVFNRSTIENLKDIYAYPCRHKNRYVSSNQWVKNPIFDADTSFNNIIFPNTNIRLLSLFRYWNIINYYYPYKYLADAKWDDVLEQFIPIFINATDTLSYHLAVCELVATINDNHGYIYSEVINQFFGNNFLPVKFKLIEGKTIVSHVYSDSLAQLNNLRLGDVVNQIDGINIQNVRDSLFPYFSGSNDLFTQHTVSYYLSRSSNKSIRLVLLRGDSTIATTAKTYSRGIISKERKKKKKIDPVTVISDSITYVDLSKITFTNINTLLSGILNSPIIIFDLRKNCQFIIHDLCEVLFKNKFLFYAVTTPNYNKPGQFCYRIGDMSGPENIDTIGFNGSLILLLDEGTQSIGEFTAMALMKHSNVASIGNRTAGADGNISAIYLPGNIQTYISGIGIYWPTGEVTQRVGIVPDLIVEQEIESVKLGRDDILQSAILYAKSLEK